MKTLMSMLTAAVLISSGAAFAETAAPAKPVATLAAVTAPAAKKMQHVAGVQSEKSKKCSADADLKNLHGKERKEFRRACLKAA